MEEEILRQAQDERDPEEALRQAQGERDTAVGERDAAVGTLRQAQGESEALREQLGAAVLRYREVLVASMPEVPPELIVGESVEALDAALEEARKVVEAIKARIPIDSPVVSGGAPVRAGPDVSEMSAVEKIRFGLSKG